MYDFDLNGFAVHFLCTSLQSLIVLFLFNFCRPENSESSPQKSRKRQHSNSENDEDSDDIEHHPKASKTSKAEN